MRVAVHVHDDESMHDVRRLVLLTLMLFLGMSMMMVMFTLVVGAGDDVHEEAKMTFKMLCGRW